MINTNEYASLLEIQNKVTISLSALQALARAGVLPGVFRNEYGWMFKREDVPEVLRLLGEEA
jgi:hypothetical protein